MIATLNESDDDDSPGPEMVAVLVDGVAPVYGFDAASTSCTLPDAPEATVPMLQPTVPLELVPPPVAETNDHPAGITSAIVTPLAEPPPVFA